MQPIYQPARPAPRPPLQAPRIQPAPRDFATDLATSQSEEHAQFWNRAFYAGFPGLACWIENRGDNVAQRRGVDAVLHFDNDTVLRVDMKADTHEPRNYFLEYVSADTTRAPGWICKSLACDYIAYGFLNHGRCDFLPWRPLSLAWQRYGRKWREQYGEKVVRNRTYNAHGVAVPVPVVRAAMLQVMQVQVEVVVE